MENKPSFEHKAQSPHQLIERCSVFGALDLRQVTHKDWLVLKEYLTNSYDTIDPAVRLQLIEQLILTGSLSDKEAATILTQKTSTEEYQTLFKFLLNLDNTEQFPHLFRACLHNVSPAEQQSAIREFMYQHVAYDPLEEYKKRIAADGSKGLAEALVHIKEIRDNKLKNERFTVRTQNWIHEYEDYRTRLIRYYRDIKKRPKEKISAVEQRRNEDKAFERALLLIDCNPVIPETPRTSIQSWARFQREREHGLGIQFAGNRLREHATNGARLQSFLERAFELYEHTPSESLKQTILNIFGNIQTGNNGLNRKWLLEIAPYIGRAVQANILSETQGKQLFSNIQEGYIDCNTESFATLEEIEIFETEKTGTVLEKSRSIGSIDAWALENVEPRSKRRRVGNIADQSTIRKAHAIFDEFPQYKHLINNPLEFITSENRGNFFILAIEKTRPSFEEITAIVNRLAMEGSLFETFGLLEIKTLLAYRPEGVENPEKKMEKLVLNALQWLLANNEQQFYCLNRLVDNIEYILPNFSESGQKKLQAAITKLSPNLWFKNIKAFVRLGGNIEHIIQATYQTDPEIILRMFKEVKQAHPNPEQVVQVVKNIFQEHPVYIVDNSTELAEALLTPQEINAYISKGLQQPIESWFFGQLCKSTYAKKYRNQIKGAIHDDPELLAIYIQAKQSKFLSESYLQERMVAWAAEFDWKEVLGYTKHYDALLSRMSDKQWNQIIQAVHTKDAVPHLFALFRKAEDLAEENPDLAYRRDQIRNVLESVIIDNPMLAFESELGSRGTKQWKEWIGEIMYAHAHEVINHNPYLIFQLPEPKTGQEKKIVHALVETHERAIATYIGSYGGTLPLEKRLFSREQYQRLLGVNPLVELYETKLEEDFYRIACNELRGTPFWKFYQDTLENITNKQNELYGPRMNTKEYQIDATFLRISHQVVLLNNSDTAKALIPYITSLSPTKQNEVLDALAYLVHYNADDFWFEHGDSDKYTTILTHMTNKVASSFGVELDHVISLKHITPITLKAMMTYSKTVTRNYPSLNTALKKYFPMLIHESFDVWRMWGILQDSIPTNEQERALEQLKSDGLIPTNMTLKQYLAWNEIESSQVSEHLALSLKDTRNYIRETCNAAVADEHISQTDLETYSYGNFAGNISMLMEPVRHIAARMKTLRKRKKLWSKEDEQEYEQLKQEHDNHLEMHAEEIQKNKAGLYLSRIQDITAEEIEKMCIKNGKQYIPFKTVFALLQTEFQGTAFTDDIERMHRSLTKAHEDMFSGARVHKTELTITDRVHAGVYFNIGEEPVPSCQSPSSSLNTGLLSYVVDPHTKILQVYDEAHVLIARSVMRLVEDDEGNPHIFLERVYSTNAHHAITQSMLAVARNKAQAIGGNLYIKEVMADSDIEHQAEKKTLHQRGSRTPYIYTDAAGGTKQGGVFTIENARRIN